MKNIIMILAVFMSTGLFAQDMDAFTVRVDGLGCPFCAYGLEKKFTELEGIDAIAIDMETGVLTFDFPASAGLSLEKVADQVNAAGYTAVESNVSRANGTDESIIPTETIVNEESQLVEFQMSVAGNCDMCKSRIENAALSTQGVVEASWDKDTQVLHFVFDKMQTDEATIGSNIAASGHDNDEALSMQETYDNLPGCCKYERDATDDSTPEK